MTRRQQRKRRLQGQIGKLLAKGLTYQDIAEQRGTTRQNIQEFFRPNLKTRNEIKTNCRSLCQICGAETPNGHIHHLETNNKQGSLVYLCNSCHSKEHNATLFKAIVNCAQCEKEIELIGAQGKGRYLRSKQFFCSKRCQGQYAGTHYSRFGQAKVIV